MGKYSIKELERLSQVKAHTIRIWEKRYGLLKPKRSDTNIRSYSDADLRRLLNIATLSQRGMKVSHIARLSASELESTVLQQAPDAAAPDNEIEALVSAMVEMDAERFERIISSAVLRLGFEPTMRQLLIPFLDRVGVLWQVGTIHPGQEHFVSLIIRQKLIAAIDGLAPRQRPNKRSIILFLPEGELHEIGLLFSLYIARSAGHKVIYLGQSVPLPDLQAVAQRNKPDLLVTAFLTTQDPEVVRTTLIKLARIDKRCVVAAHVTGTPPERPPSNVKLLGGLDDLTALMA